MMGVHPCFKGIGWGPLELESSQSVLCPGAGLLQFPKEIGWPSICLSWPNYLCSYRSVRAATGMCERTCCGYFFVSHTKGEGLTFKDRFTPSLFALPVSCVILQYLCEEYANNYTLNYDNFFPSFFSACKSWN